MDSAIFKTDNIKNHYKFDKVLGEGTFAVVRKAIKKSNNMEYAIKIIDKGNLESDDQMALQNEVEILSQIDHPNIVKLLEVYDQQDNFYMVMELMTGGELFDRIVDKEFYSEKEAADTIKPLVDALCYCHKMGVAHRDLKPENLLFSSPDPNATIKISDFGLAKVINTSTLMTTACGTPGYVAPEILNGAGYSQAVDYWSIGIILYVMLCGFPPFYEDNNEKLFGLIQSGKFNFPSPQWDNISAEAKDLIKNLLVVDPNKRYSAQKIVDHPWLSKGKALELELPITKNMKEVMAKRKLKRAQLTVLAATRLKKTLKNLE